MGLADHRNKAVRSQFGCRGHVSSLLVLGLRHYKHRWRRAKYKKRLSSVDVATAQRGYFRTTNTVKPKEEKTRVGHSPNG